MTHTLPMLRASFRMLSRSRGVIYAMVSTSVMIVAFGLMGDLGFGFGSNSVDFFDFVLPGMAAFLAIYTLQDTVIALAASYKARGVLRRLAITPVSPATVIASQITSYIVLGLAASSLALGVGWLVGARLAIGPNLLWLIPIVAIAYLTALSISFAIAGLTPNPPTANIVGGALVLPLFALTGVILPIEALPAPLPDVVTYALPYTALIEAIRGIALNGDGITAYGQQVLIGLAWLVAVFLVASRVYRFTEE
jgi:ABC-2 type transport system permease protein